MHVNRQTLLGRISKGPDEREDARLALGKSVREARQAVENLEGTTDPELRPLVSQLIIQVELGADAVKHPNTLKR